jgi:anti-sigma B factor antagonist
MFVARHDRPARSARMQPFRLCVGEGRPGCYRIEVRGELDLAVTDRLSKALASAGEHREVLVDLERCDFIDSAAVEAILRAEAGLTLEGRRILVVGARGQVLQVLNVLGLTDRGLVISDATAAPVDAPAVVAA